MLFLNLAYNPSAERARASPEAAPGSARAPQVTFAQVVAEVMDRAQVRPLLQADELVGATDGLDPMTPEDDAGLPGAPDAPATLQGDTQVLPAPGHRARAGHDLPLQDDLSLFPQVAPAVGQHQSVPPRTAPPPLPAVGDSPVLAAAAAKAEGIAAYPFAESRVAPGPEATHSTLASVPEDMPSPPFGPVPEGVSTSYVSSLAQPFRGETAAPLATNSGPAAGAKVGDAGIMVPPEVPMMQLSPDAPPPDALTFRDRIVAPQLTEGMRDAIVDLAPAVQGRAHSATSPGHLPLHAAQDSAMPVAAASLPRAPQATASRDSIAEPPGTQTDSVRAETAASPSPHAPPVAFGQANNFDRLTNLRDPVPAAGAKFAPVPDRQASERQPVPTAPVPVQQIPLPTPGITRWLAVAPVPQPLAIPRVAVEAALGRAARQAAAEISAVPPPDVTPGTVARAIDDTTVPAAPVKPAPTVPAAMSMPPQPLQPMIFQPDPAARWPVAKSPAPVQVTPIGTTPTVPAAMTMPPPPALQAVALQPALVAPWSVAASPPSEPTVATDTSIAPLPSPLPTGIAAYAADPVDWRIQRLYAVQERPPNPAEPAPGTPRDDLMPLRAVKADQGMPGPQPSAFSAAPLMAQAVTRQVLDPLAQGVQRGQSGQITVHLSPVELGRVEIAMQPREAGMALIILAERPEVLELLRRHIDLLADDMRAMGYSDLSFQFGAGTDRRGVAAPGVGQNDELPDTGASPNDPPPVTPPAKARHDGRLDLRF